MFNPRCIVCQAKSGEIEPDKVEFVFEFGLGGKPIPMKRMSIAIDYIASDGTSRRHPLCEEHQRMVDKGRPIQRSPS